VSNPTRATTLAHARELIGIREIPPGSNKTPIGVEFGWNGVPWCAETVCVILLRAGFAIKKNASAWGLGRQLVKAGWKKISPDKLEAGDVVVFKFSHVGICEARKDATRLVTIEGNHGDRVARAIRSESVIDYGVRPPYAASPVKPKKHPVLSVGDTGKAVVALQKYLIHKGFSCGKAGADGDFGGDTRKAVRAYQMKRLPRLIAGVGQWDGIVGVNTWKAIDANK